MNQPFTFERQLLDSGLLNEEQLRLFEGITKQLFGSQMGRNWLSLVTLAIPPTGPSIVTDQNGGIDMQQTVAYDSVRSTIGYLCAASQTAPHQEQETT